VGVTAGERVGWADEMRLGLLGTVRRVWAPRGVKVRQVVQMRREWQYLNLVADARAGRLWWCWTDTMKGAELAGVVRGWRQETDLDAVVWDGAPGHRGPDVAAVGFPLVIQPPYAPELNPAERVFQELRRAVARSARTYPTLAAKVAAIHAELERLEADPERVRRLVGWAWIRNALDQLPAAQPRAA
jgi:hypothetical protein